jgi:hypothetical protein
LSVRQLFLDFNARSGDLIKSPTLADTLVGQKVFLDRLKSSYILPKGIALGLDREKVFFSLDLDENSPRKLQSRREYTDESN